MVSASVVRGLAACATALLLTACSPASTSAGPAPTTAAGSSASGSPTAGPSPDAPCLGTPAPAWEHVVWILMENHGDDQVLGNADAPYLNSLAGRCGLATAMHAITHPSLPNYIALTSGSTQGITDDEPPAAHPLAAASLFSQLGAQGWRSLLESMPAPCHPTDAPPYVVRHNPATYYTGLAADCPARDVALADVPDLSARFTFIAPNQRHNTHDTSVADGDAWLAGFLPQVLGSAEYRSGSTAVFITYDEDEDTGGDNSIPALVIAPSTPSGTVVQTPLTHYSLLRTTEEMLGVPLLGEAATAASMRAPFHLG